jgi:hypothetical protein
VIVGAGAATSAGAAIAGAVAFTGGVGAACCCGQPVSNASGIPASTHRPRGNLLRRVLCVVILNGMKDPCLSSMLACAVPYFTMPPPVFIVRRCNLLRV